MEAINKNKEEIEKIGCRDFLPKNFVGDRNIWKCGQWGLVDGINTQFICQSCKDKREERIKTSILWCEGILKYLDEEEDEIIYDQLQTHLNWLKEQEEENEISK